jgi:hypothetical protein
MDVPPVSIFNETSKREYEQREEEGTNILDYRCEGGRSQASPSWVTIWNPNSLSSSETGVNPGIRSREKHTSDWAKSQKAIGGIYVTKKWRAETLQPGMEFDIFKPQLKSSIFNCVSQLNGPFFSWGDSLGFLGEGVKIYLMALISHSLANVFLPSHL